MRDKIDKIFILDKRIKSDKKQKRSAQETVAFGTPFYVVNFIKREKQIEKFRKRYANTDALYGVFFLSRIRHANV